MLLSSIEISDALKIYRVRFYPRKFPFDYYRAFVRSYMHGVDTMLLSEILSVAYPNLDERAHAVNCCAVMEIFKANKKLIPAIAQTNSYLSRCLDEVYLFDYHQHLSRLRNILDRP